jgi:hypothetical protein
VYLDVSGTCVRFWAVLFWFLLAAYAAFNKRLPVLFISYNSMQSSVASSFSNSHLSWINLMIVVVCQCMGITSCDESSQLSDLRRITLSNVIKTCINFTVNSNLAQVFSAVEFVWSILQLFYTRNKMPPTLCRSTLYVVVNVNSHLISERKLPEPREVFQFKESRGR